MNVEFYSLLCTHVNCYISIYRNPEKYETIVVMYIERVPNRNSPPAVLLRESYREGEQVKKRTLANLSSLPDDVKEKPK